MQFRTILSVGSALAISLATLQVQAKVSAEEAAKLGGELSPIGADKSANADGSIPEWTGGEPASGDLAGQWPDETKYVPEKPIATVTKANMAEYAEKLTEGHKMLLTKYPTYKMDIYKSHRPVTYPKAILDATKANATTAFLDGDPDRIKGAKMGFPFPIAKSGGEAMWNHRLRWRGESVRRYNNQAIVQPSGGYQISKLVEDVKFTYGSIKNPQSFENEDDVGLYYLSETLAPPRNAGQFLLGWEHPYTRSAWLYNPGLRRIRRAPNVGFDNPYEGTDGNQFYDQVDMFNGSFERYTWKLVGKKEIYIPYNSHKINLPKYKYDDIVQKNHINQDLARYELHRVWVVEADLKAGTSHSFKKRRFYIDEDSWYVVAVDCYDNRDELWKFQEGHAAYTTNVQAVGGVPELIYDFQTTGYFATAMINEDKPNDFSVEYDDKFFTTQSVKKKTSR